MKTLIVALLFLPTLSIAGDGARVTVNSKDAEFDAEYRRLMKNLEGLKIKDPETKIETKREEKK